MATEIKEFCFNIMTISFTTRKNSIMSPSTIKSNVAPTFIYGRCNILLRRAIVVIYVNLAIKIGQISFDYPSSYIDFLNNGRSFYFFISTITIPGICCICRAWLWWEQAFCNKSLVYIYQKLLNNYFEMEQEQYIHIYVSLLTYLYMCILIICKYIYIWIYVFFSPEWLILYFNFYIRVCMYFM